jgi:predicted GNAT family acetyltransferase
MLKRKEAAPQEGTSGSFEIEQDGQVAYLQYRLTPDVLELIHTEVPAKLAGKGIGSQLAEKALRWAREHKLKVNIVCPFVKEYVAKHPEYSDLILK